MMRYLTLFKGLNVGGKHTVKMQELRQMFQDLHFANVQTYIQSGNVVFDAETEEKAVCETLKRTFSSRFGFESSVVLRTAEEMSHIAGGLPFSAEEIDAATMADPQVAHLYVIFLEASPDAAQAAGLQRLNSPTEKKSIDARTLYLLLHRSIRESKLATAVTKDFPHATTRNWKTVQRLFEMMV